MMLQGQCFRSGAVPLPGLAVHLGTLGSDAIDGLSQLLPLLQCGEESASAVFEAMAQATDVPARQALQLIADEERHHEGLLDRLAAALPVPARRSMRPSQIGRFYVSLRDTDLERHAARIAALDAAACTIFAHLLRGAVGSAPDVARLFAHIRRDEARHVRLARALALRRGASPALSDAAAQTRSALAALLAQASGALEQLDVDADLLLKQLRALPDGLLRP